MVTIGQFRIGLCHGHQIVPWDDQFSLAALQRKVGFIHGSFLRLDGTMTHEILLALQMNVDILITGHSHQYVSLPAAALWHWSLTGLTHRYHIRTEGGKWFVNPGSITGAFSGQTSDVIPSFILMAIQGSKVVAFVYELKGDNVVVSRSEFTKEN